MKKRLKIAKKNGKTRAAQSLKPPRLINTRLRSLVKEGFSDPNWIKKVLTDGEQELEKNSTGLRFLTLASGSSGNCLCVMSSNTLLLVDAGITIACLTTGLAQIGVTPKMVSAVLLTHEHSDHYGSAALVLHRQYGVPLYANKGTAEAVARSIGINAAVWQIFETGSQFTVGDLTIESFAVSHDAADPVGFVISDKCTRLGIATDLGRVTKRVERKLSGCDALVLEANHDIEMLCKSTHPKYRIRRIKGFLGHLSNEQAATLLASVLCPRLKTVVLAHISSECNTPELATDTVKQVLVRAGRSDIHIAVAEKATGVVITLAQQQQAIP